MRLNISGVKSKALPKWRADARARFRYLPGDISRDIRECVAARMGAEAMKAAFKTLGRHRRIGQRAEEDAIHDAKIESIMEWKADEIEEGEFDEFDVAEMAERSTLARGKKEKAGRDVKRHYKAVKWAKVKVGGKMRRVPSHYVERKIIKKRVKLGKKLIPAANIKRMIAGKSYWDRIKTLAAAMQITKSDGKLDLLRARKTDHKMMNVPDNVRRRIYDECVEKAASQNQSLPIHVRGVKLLPKNRKEGREKWGAVGDGHGNKKGKGRPSHRGGTGGRR
jgi:hypothetical protein